MVTAHEGTHIRGKGRRPIGWLKSRVFELLAQSDRPLGSVALTEMLRREGESLQQPIVARALQQLFAAGRVTRVELATGYIPVVNEATAAALCRFCGRYAALAGASPVAELRALAQLHGFTASRVVVELKGVCADCRDVGQDRSGRPGQRRHG